MSTEFFWHVRQMDAIAKGGIVKTVHWTLTGTQGDVAGSAYGTVKVTYEEGSEFTPYEKLSEEQVIEWVKAALGDEQVAQQEAAVEAQIAQQLVPVVVSPPLPWAE